MLPTLRKVISVNGIYTHFTLHVQKTLRTLVIKMFLRTLLACCLKNSVTSENGNYSHAPMHVCKCLNTLWQGTQEDTFPPLHLKINTTSVRNAAPREWANLLHPHSPGWEKKPWRLQTWTDSQGQVRICRSPACLRGNSSMPSEFGCRGEGGTQQSRPLPRQPCTGPICVAAVVVSSPAEEVENKRDEALPCYPCCAGRG